MGDQSLTEAIQLKKAFIYEIPVYKVGILFYLYQYARLFGFHLVAEFLELNQGLFYPKDEKIGFEKGSIERQRISKEDISAFGDFLRSWKKTTNTERFMGLYFSQELQHEFFLFNKKLLESNMALWNILRMLLQKLQEKK